MSAILTLINCQISRLAIGTRGQSFKQVRRLTSQNNIRTIRGLVHTNYQVFGINIDRSLVIKYLIYPIHHYCNLITQWKDFAR